MKKLINETQPDTVCFKKMTPVEEFMPELILVVRVGSNNGALLQMKVPN